MTFKKIFNALEATNEFLKTAGAPVHGVRVPHRGLSTNYSDFVSAVRNEYIPDIARQILTNEVIQWHDEFLLTFIYFGEKHEIAFTFDI